MLIVISPSKTQDFTNQVRHAEYTIPVLLDESAQLIEALRKLTTIELSKLMDISPKLAEVNFYRYQQFSTGFNLNNARQAIFAFKGDVYTDIDITHYNKTDFDFADKHLRILSGLYGLVRPLDLIQPYRLEMKTKLKNQHGDNLYKFWGNKITDLLNNASSEILINLASQEYFAAINPVKLKAKIVTISFKEQKGNNYQIVAIHAKRARGMMTNFIIKNKIHNVKELAQFNEKKYSFNKELSTESELVFTR